MRELVTIAYPCPTCGTGQAFLPVRSDATRMVRCARCDRQHGRLEEVRQEIAHQAREEAAQRARQIYRLRPTEKYRSPDRRPLEV